MDPAVKTINCSSCGAATSPNKSECEYCGNYLLHLTVFERRKQPSSSPQEARYFRSLKRLYQGALGIGVIAAILIYFVFFNDLSEDELVLISPSWFLLIIFGTSGLFSERAVHRILQKEAPTFADALVKSTKGVSPILVIGVFLVFLLPAFILGLGKRLSSPLLIALIITLVWGAALYIFLIGFFPYM